MIGRKLFGQIDKQLHQIFPHRSHEILGGCSCLLFRDFDQLPPVMDLPLYTTIPRTELSDLGSTIYHSFDQAVVLDQIMHQAGEDPEQVLFCNILLRLRNGESTISDWQELMKHTPSNVGHTMPFSSAVHLFPTTDSVAEYNINQLCSISRPIATIKAVHTGHDASKASSEEVGGLDPIIHLAHEARVMLIANLWVEAGLVNGAVGTVVSICYENGGPPDLPLAVTVRFGYYTDPTLADQTVPITPIRRTWSTSATNCSRLQVPLKLAWAVTIHKSQGLTMDKVVIDIGRKEFSSGLTYVAISRVWCLKDLLFSMPFAYHHLSNLSKSQRLQEQIREDRHLQSIQQPLPPALSSQEVIPLPPRLSSQEVTPSPPRPLCQEVTPLPPRPLSQEVTPRLSSQEVTP